MSIMTPSGAQGLRCASPQSSKHCSAITLAILGVSPDFVDIYGAFGCCMSKLEVLTFPACSPSEPLPKALLTLHVPLMLSIFNDCASCDPAI